MMMHVESIKLIAQVKFKTTMLKPSLYIYSDTYILVKGTISVLITIAASVAANNDKKN